MLGMLLDLGRLGAAVLAPLAAAVAVYRAESPRSSPLANWLGLTIAGELGVAFPLFALSVGVQGFTHWPYYHAAPAFALPALAVAILAAKEHFRRLRGKGSFARRAGYSCLGLAALVAVALIPWILGAPLPFGGGWFGQEITFAGDVHSYGWVVLPFALAMEVEAWLLMGWPPRTARPWGAILAILDIMASAGVAVLILGAVLVLPSSRWNSYHAAKLERAALRAQAEALDAPRRRALAEIVAGHAPRLLQDRCSAETTPESWRQWQRFTKAPKDWDELVRLESQWSFQKAVDVLRSVMATTGSTLAGPRRCAIFASLDDRNWVSPWHAKDILVAPEEARRRVRAWVDLAAWEVDATLIVSRENLSFSVQGKTTFGNLEGTLWVWSYREQAFVCAAEVSVPHAGMQSGFTDRQAPTVRDSIRMRALAQAVGNLRTIERQP